MPKPIKKKVSKKARLKEAEVKSRVHDTINFLRGRRKVLTYALSALALIVILTVVFIFYSFSLKKKAHAFEREAYNYYYDINIKNPLPGEARWKKSLELFQKAMEVKSTPVAQFYIGNCYFNLGDYNNAIKAYIRFTDKYKNEQEILPLVYQKLALAYIKNGKGDDAVKTLKTLAQFKNGLFKDTALSLEAQYYESTGKPEDALKKYKELLENFPSSPWSAVAKTKIETEESQKSDVGMSVESMPADKE